VIHAGVKVDNLIQIAHNVEIGSHTVMAAHTGIAGSTKIGEWCMFGGQTGIAGHLKVADHTQTGAKTGITKSIRQPGTAHMGTYSVEVKKYLKINAAQRMLPDFVEQLKALQKKVDELEKKLN
jgi:UDP-3-O-[3-hydroxymyristoyl] glucosamine N-acyltransferase